MMLICKQVNNLCHKDHRRNTRKIQEILRLVAAPKLLTRILYHKIGISTKWNKEGACNSGQTGQHTQVILTMEQNMASGNLYSLISLYLKDNLDKTMFSDTVFILGQTANSTEDNGCRTKCMALDNSHGTIKQSIRDHLGKTNGMATVDLRGPMVNSTMVFGIKENNMALEYIRTKMVIKCTVFG